MFEMENIDDELKQLILKIKLKSQSIQEFNNYSVNFMNVDSDNLMVYLYVNGMICENVFIHNIKGLIEEGKTIDEIADLAIEELKNELINEKHSFLEGFLIGLIKFFAALLVCQISTLYLGDKVNINGINIFLAIVLLFYIIKNQYKRSIRRKQK